MANSISKNSKINNSILSYQAITGSSDDGLSMVKLNQANFNCFFVRGTQ